MDFSCPTDHTQVKQSISSAHRMLGSLAVNRKLPSTSKSLKDAHREIQVCILGFLQILTLITLGFVGFLRWDDLINLNISDPSFHVGEAMSRYISQTFHSWSDMHPFKICA